MKGIYESVVLARLIETGKKAGKLNINQLNDALLESDISVELIDEFYNECEKLNIVIDDTSNAIEEELEKEEDFSDLIGKTNNFDRKFDFVKAYFDDMKQYPLLSGDEELELGRLMLEGTDEQRTKAKNQLINCNLRLVISIAKKYRGKSNEPFLDVIQSGNIGLMKAVDRYDYRKGYKFSTYASWWIRQAITRSSFDNGRTIRIPIPVMVKITALKKARAVLVDKFKKEPTNQDLADYMGIDVEKVRELIYYSQEPVSIETPVGEEDAVLGDFIPDPSYETPIDYSIKKNNNDKIFELAQKVLSERELQVILMRMGFLYDKIYTLEEVGDYFKVTRERARQIEAKALRKLRKHKSELGFNDD